MSVPEGLRHKVEQQVRDFVLWALEFDTDDEKKRVIVPRKGKFDDGTEIRDTRPDPPFLLVNHNGTATKTGQESVYIDNDAGDVFYLTPYRSTVSINGYGRQADDWVYRLDMLAPRWSDGTITVISNAGVRDLSQLVEDETIEARYQVDLAATYIARLKVEGQAVPADKIEATINQSELVEQTL